MSARRVGLALRCLAPLGMALVFCGAQASASAETWRFGPFGEVAIYSPAAAPGSVVLFLSGDGGWNLGVVPMAERLRDLGALVVGIDIRTFLRSLSEGKGCAYPAGALEELARAVQVRARLPEYHRPILVGYSSGASLAYAAIASAPVETFVGAISLGFCPDVEIGRALCSGRALSSTPRRRGPGCDMVATPALEVPWMVLQGDIDQVCSPEKTRRFVAGIPSAHLFWLPKVGHGFGVTRRWDAAYVGAYREIVRRAAERVAALPVAGGDIAGLPLIEVPADSGEASLHRDTLAILFTGDGGWAEIDKGIAHALAQQGVSVVGWSSLRYFWQPRTPEQAAGDLDRVIAHYTQAWGRHSVLLLGYSFGADVLPFLYNRLSKPQRAEVAAVALVGLSSHAEFEFHVAGWLHDEGQARYPTSPEIDRAAAPVLCVSGADEPPVGCGATHGRTITLPGGHHFDRDYDRLGSVILDHVDAATAEKGGGR